MKKKLYKEELHGEKTTQRNGRLIAGPTDLVGGKISEENLFES